MFYTVSWLGTGFCFSFIVVTKMFLVSFIIVFCLIFLFLFLFCLLLLEMVLLRH